MESKTFEITIEVLAKEIEQLNSNLRFEKCIRELKEKQVEDLKAENKRLNELLTPTKKGADNE